MHVEDYRNYVLFLFPLYRNKYLFSSSSMALREQTKEGVQNVRPESKSILSPLIPQTKTDEEHVPSPNDSLPMNVYHNVMAQFQSCPSRSLQVLPYDSSSRSSHQQFPRYLPFQMTRINPQGIPPAMMPQYNKGHLWPHPPTLTDFPKFVHAWEGTLVGRTHSYRDSLNQARAVRRPTSPVRLTAEWRPSLDIVIFIPTNAINYTIMTYGGPIDYVLFHITHFDNFNLHNHMRSKNLCAKILLPYQTIILSLTDSKYHFLGAIFHGVSVILRLRLRV
ncbi:Mediator of RNA polymerase II transcription subunit 25 [Glycine soja]